MLVITERATDVIKQAVEVGDLPESAGVRIAPQPSTSGDVRSFGASLAAEPEGDDEVVEVGGARVFLDPVASVEFDDKVLDAQVRPDGMITLAFAEQEGYAKDED